MRIKKTLKYLIPTVIVLVLAGGFIAAKYMLPYAIIQPPRITEKISPADLQLESQNIALTVEDTIELKGYWVKTKVEAPESVMIFVHGIGGCKEHFLGLAQDLSRLGIESVLVDMRAHGQSGGQFTTYGYKEKHDISAVVDLIKRQNDSIPIGIWGNSMGGAIALQALEIEPRIEFGIIESTFTDLDQIVYDYQKKMAWGIGLKPLCNIALAEAGRLADFDPDAVVPLESVKNIQQPVFIAHGTLDENIKFDYGYELYKKLNTRQKHFYPVEGGGHFDLGQVGGPLYYRAIQEFIFKHSN